MAKKEDIVIAISIVILVIAAGISFQNYQNAKQAKKQIDKLNIEIQDRDTQIVKLIKDIRRR
jgi:uncharacterized membrane protein YvbJ